MLVVYQLTHWGLGNKCRHPDLSSTGQQTVVIVVKCDLCLAGSLGSLVTRRYKRFGCQYWLHLRVPGTWNLGPWSKNRPNGVNHNVNPGSGAVTCSCAAYPRKSLKNEDEAWLAVKFEPHPREWRGGPAACLRAQHSAARSWVSSPHLFNCEPVGWIPLDNWWGGWWVHPEMLPRSGIGQLFVFHLHSSARNWALSPYFEAVINTSKTRSRFSTWESHGCSKKFIHSSFVCEAVKLANWKEKIEIWPSLLVFLSRKKAQMVNWSKVGWWILLPVMFSMCLNGLRSVI